MTGDYHRGSGPYVDGRPLTAETLYQRVLNEDWPLRDPDGARHARGISDRPIDEQRPVTARLELHRDGVVYLPGRAARWTDLPADRAHVLVIVDDPRVPRGMVWLRFTDVRPR